MNYYILLPSKIKMSFTLDPIYDETPNPTISSSLINHLTHTHSQIQTIKSNLKKKKDSSFIFKLFNSYNLLYENIPYHNYPISKIKCNSLLYYNLIELNNIINLNELLSSFNLNISLSCEENNLVMKYLDDNNISYNMDEMESLQDTLASYNPTKSYEYTNKIDFIMFELDSAIYNKTQTYITSVIYILYFTLLNQNVKGSLVIKISHIFYKPLIDIIHILTNFYQKVYIVKPNIANHDERFVVCKYFNNYDSISLINGLEDILCNIIIHNKKINAILSNPIPLYLENKIDESNIIIGFHALECCDEIINILKSKNIDEKIDTYVRYSINKCIQWCKNARIDYNEPEANNYTSLKT